MIGEGDLLQEYLDTAVKAAEKAGAFLLKTSLSGDIKEIRAKGKNDYVTEVDRESEKLIIGTIRAHFPNHSFLAEESGISGGGDSKYVWIIDPLDGTINFINGYPIWGVSIALKCGSDLLVGVINDPIHGELFYAKNNGGAYLNDEPIEVSMETDFRNALLLTGFPFKAQEHIDPYLKSFKKLFYRSSGIRRAGSASIDLAWLACGRADAFWEIGLSPWDVAAGTLIVREAGGVVTDVNGDSVRFLETGHIVASTEGLHSGLLDVTSNVLGHLDPKTYKK